MVEDMADTRRAVLALIARYAGCEPRQLADDDSLRADLWIDAIDLCDMTMEMEPIAGCDITQEVMTAWETVGDVVRWVEMQDSP